jgi:hypothetical protein
MALMFKTALLAQGYTISGRAYDEADKKFGPVRVVLYDQDKKKIFEEKTAGSGKFKIKDIVNGKYTMNIYGEGGRGVTENITINGADINDLKKFSFFILQIFLPLLAHLLEELRLFCFFLYG